VSRLRTEIDPTRRTVYRIKDDLAGAVGVLGALEMFVPRQVQCDLQLPETCILHRYILIIASRCSYLLYCS
jgi:hypothetical protein